MTREPLDIELGCSDTQCTAAAVAPNGGLVVYEPVAQTLNFVDDERVVEVAPDLVDAWLAQVGPDDVAYFVANRFGGGDPVGDLVAVATVGPREGQVVARVDGVVDTSGDSRIVPTAAGLVSVGCCGHGDRQPAIDEPVLLRWVGSDGEDLEPLPVDVWLEYPSTGGVVAVRSDGGSEQRWVVTGLTVGRDMPLMVATSAGGVRVWSYDPIFDPDALAVLYDAHADGTIDRYELPDLTWAYLGGDGVVAVDREQRLVRLRIP